MQAATLGVQAATLGVQAATLCEQVELLEDALEAPLAAAAEAGVSWGVAGHPGGLLLQASLTLA